MTWASTPSRSVYGHMIQNGVVTNRQARTWTRAGPSVHHRRQLHLTPCEQPPPHHDASYYTNDPWSSHTQDNMVSINAVADRPDRPGGCWRPGPHPVLRYRRRYRLCLRCLPLPGGGRAMLCQISTAKKLGTVSRIAPILDPGSIVSVSRNLTDMVITEYGVAKAASAHRKAGEPDRCCFTLTSAPSCVRKPTSICISNPAGLLIQRYYLFFLATVSFWARWLFLFCHPV